MAVARLSRTGTPIGSWSEWDQIWSKLDQNGEIEVNVVTMQTKVENISAIGDVVGIVGGVTAGVMTACEIPNDGIVSAAWLHVKLWPKESL